MGSSCGGVRERSHLRGATDRSPISICPIWFSGVCVFPVMVTSETGGVINFNNKQDKLFNCSPFSRSRKRG